MLEEKSQMWRLGVGGRVQLLEVLQKIPEFWADTPHLFSRHQPLWFRLNGQDEDAGQDNGCTM